MVNKENDFRNGGGKEMRHRKTESEVYDERVEILDGESQIKLWENYLSCDPKYIDKEGEFIKNKNDMINDILDNNLDFGMFGEL